jgi:hypothetical protein
MSHAAPPSGDRSQVDSGRNARSRLTLEQKLARFEVAKHGGEVMTDPPVGRECLPADREPDDGRRVS